MLADISLELYYGEPLPLVVDRDGFL